MPTSQSCPPCNAETLCCSRRASLPRTRFCHSKSCVACRTAQDSINFGTLGAHCRRDVLQELQSLAPGHSMCGRCPVSGKRYYGDPLMQFCASLPPCVLGQNFVALCKTPVGFVLGESRAGGQRMGVAQRVLDVFPHTTA